jgi:transcriptional regulator with XRE-family HTH domain
VKAPRLKEWREARGETQVTLGERAGVSQHTILRIEHGEELRPPTARKLADALGVDITDLLASPPAAQLAGKAEPPATGPATGPLASAELEAAQRRVDAVLEEAALRFGEALGFEKHVARMATGIHFILSEAESALGELGDAQEYTERFGPELAERYRAYVDVVRAASREFEDDLYPLLLRMHASRSRSAASSGATSLVEEVVGATSNAVEEATKGAQAAVERIETDYDKRDAALKEIARATEAQEAQEASLSEEGVKS